MCILISFKGDILVNLLCKLIDNQVATIYIIFTSNAKKEVKQKVYKLL